MNAISAGGTEDSEVRDDVLDDCGDLCAGVMGLELSRDDWGWALSSIHISSLLLLGN